MHFKGLKTLDWKARENPGGRETPANCKPFVTEVGRPFLSRFLVRCLLIFQEVQLAPNLWGHSPPPALVASCWLPSVNVYSTLKLPLKTTGVKVIVAHNI